MNNLMDTINQFETRQEKIKTKENRKALSVLRKAKKMISKKEIEDNYIYGNIDWLLRVYFNLKGTEKGEFLEKIMLENGLNLSPSFHNAIYHLLGNEADYIGIRVEPTKFIGVDEVVSNGIKHMLHTKMGKIEVYNATEVFKCDKSGFIFKRQLPRLCYARTYDFIKMNPDSSRAVIMKMPNFFYDGHYHAYIERQDDVIDIAANAYYSSLEEASKVLNGEVVGKYTFDEIQDFCKNFDCKSFNENSKIYVLTAFKTMK